MKSLFLKIGLVLILVALALGVNLLPSKKLTASGDSGFDADYYDYDNDYGGGGSYGGGYGGGGYSYDYDDDDRDGRRSYGGGYTSSGDSSDGGGNLSDTSRLIAIFVVIILVFGLAFMPLWLPALMNSIRYRKYKNGHMPYKRSSVGGGTTCIPKPDIPQGISEDPELVTKLTRKAYSDYVKIQTAWMNRDLEPVRNLLTDEMYNMYQMQIDTLNKNKQINVMKDFSYNVGYLTERTKKDQKETIKVLLGVYCKDYIINEKSKKVVSGDQNATLLYYYELTYVRAIDAKDENHCPNCGALLKNQMSQTCSHCGTNIVLNVNAYTLANKRMLKQYKM